MTLVTLFLSLRAVCATPPVSSDPFITFRPGSDILYPDYKLNNSNLKLLETTVAQYEDIILSGNGYIKLVAYVAPADKDNPIAINMAATRAAVIRTHLRQKFRMLTKWCFAFYMDIDASKENSVQAAYHSGPLTADVPGDIYYSTQKENVGAIRTMLSKYGELPFVSPDAPRQQEPAGVPATPHPVASGTTDGGGAVVAIYYRWDKSKIDSLYLSNPYNLNTLDSLLASASARHIDTLTIVAFASPEGDSVYNTRLSERRAAAIREYIVSRHHEIDPGRIVTVARGENWEGMVKFATNDQNLPSKEKILEILRSPMNEQQKQAALTRLDDGSVYYRYILPNYYTYLRLGAMVFMSYAPERPSAVPGTVEEPATSPDTITHTGPVVVAPQPESESRSEPLPAQPHSRAAKYPVALKTNLLYDLVGAANLGIEIPVGKHWSVIGDAAYAYWRAANNLYALQTLEYGLSCRYWLPVAAARKLRNPEWDKPLRGWNFGVYGRYWQRYDVQWIDGCQGDASWSAGVTAGYAFPVGRNLSFEAGLGAGYFSTSEYRTYDRPLYDKDGGYHLMWRETGRWSGITLTKVNFSLVWLIETGKGGRR